jgi:hypothetical protein
VRWSIARNRQRAVQRDEVDVKNVDTDRDASLERLMKDALRSRTPEGSDTSDAGRCLSAETLAAWSEQTLSPRERDAADAHAADCARCQAMLAAMVRMTPVPVKAPWWRVHMMAWMVPVTAATAALIVWMATTARERAPVPQQSTARAELAPPSAPPATPAPSAAPSALASELAKKELAQQPPKTALRDEAKDSKRDRSRQQEPAREESRRADANEQRALSTLAKTATAETEAQLKARQQAAPTLPAPAAAPAAPVPATPAPAPPAAAVPAPPVTAPQTAAAAPPADRRAFEGGRAAGAVAQRAERDMLASRAASAPAAPIVSPNPQNRWRIVAGGAVEHSTDAGATWQVQQTGATVTLTAGASPAPTVCWMVGSRGHVVVSIDGATWKQVPLAEPIDLIAVRAIDAKTATVTAADGRTFATADGGATWKAQ